MWPRLPKLRVGLVAASLVAMLLPAEGPARAEPGGLERRYVVLRIGGDPTDINNHGDVVGQGFDTTYWPRPTSLNGAFLWRYGAPMHNLNWDVPPTAKRLLGTAVAISDTGYVVGEWWQQVCREPIAPPFVCSRGSVGPNWDGSLDRGAYVWHRGHVRWIDGLLAATGVNDDGVVVGYTHRYESAYWHDGKLVKLVPPRRIQMSGAHGINDRGEIIGDARTYFQRPEYQRRWDSGFRWKAGRTTMLRPYGSSNCARPRDVNDSGAVVGSITLDTFGCATTRAGLWRSDSVQDLGTLPGDTYSAADAINGHGEVVGVSASRSALQRAFLYRQGRMYDLNKLIAPANAALLLMRATGINDDGWIVGDGTGIGTFGFVLMPVPLS